MLISRYIDAAFLTRIVDRGIMYNLGDAPISDIEFTISTYENIRWLQVAMNTRGREHRPR